MQLDHIGVAVNDIDEAQRIYGSALGLAASEIEDLPELHLRVCFIEAGGARIELLFPTDPQSPVGKFLAVRGPGVHHLCYRVDDVDKKLAEAKASGLRLIDEKPRRGAHGTRVAFIHPSSCAGVLTEFCQYLEKAP